MSEAGIATGSCVRMLILAVSRRRTRRWVSFNQSKWNEGRRWAFQPLRVALVRWLRWTVGGKSLPRVKARLLFERFRRNGPSETEGGAVPRYGSMAPIPIK